MIRMRNVIVPLAATALACGRGLPTEPVGRTLPSPRFLMDVGDVNATPLVGPRSQAFWSVGFLLTAWFAPLTAQQDPVTQTVVDTTAIVSLAIAAADIAPQSEASITQLRDLRSRLQPSQQIEQTGTDLDVLTSEIDSLRAAQDYDQLEDLSPGRLDVLFERWLPLARRLDGWQGVEGSRC